MDFNEIKVSIAIPVYNAGKFLEEAINSIVRQSISINEILIVDDGSSDNSLEVANRFKKRYHNIKIFQNSKNFGYAKNWNKCLEKASNRFVLLLHHDDLLKPDAIKVLLDFFKTHPEIALAGGQEDSFGDGKDIPQNSIVKRKETKIFNKGEIYEFIKETNSYIPCSSVMFDIKKILNVGFFDENYLATDELYWPRVLSHYPIAVLGKSLINRRKHPGQTEYKDFKDKRDEIMAWIPQFQKICKYEIRHDKKTLLTELINKKITYSLLVIALNVMRLFKAFNTFVFYYFKSFRFYPKVVFEKWFWKITVNSFLYCFNLKK